VPGSGVVFELTPPSADLVVGQPCGLELWLDSATRYVDELRIYLSFPPAAVQLVDAQGQPASTVNVTTTEFGAVQTNRVENAAGRAELAIGPSAVGRSGRFLLARLSMQGKASTGGAYARVGFDQDAAAGRLTEARHQGKAVVTAAQDGSYRVVAPRLLGRVQFQLGTQVAGPVAVEFLAISQATPLATAVTQPAADGSFAVAAPAPGTWDVRLRAARAAGPAALPVVATRVAVPAGDSAVVEFGCLREGDIDRDGDVDGLTGDAEPAGDLLLLVQAFGRRAPAPGEGADVNRSGTVDVVDFSLLAASSGMGEQTAPAPCN
jgi:hypothetical protein